MKINHLNSASINPYQRSAEKQQLPQAAQKQDKVEISSKAKELQQLNSIDAARQEKVAALKKQVESGTYQPDPKAVAESLFNHYKK